MKQLYKILFLLLSFSFTYAQSPTCETAAAMCSGNQGPFVNTTNVPSFGRLGCLSTTPNPAWFYMQVGVSGNMDFLLSQIRDSNGGGIDVDFILWGPFSTPINCNSLYGYSPGYTGANNVVACSYSPSPTENFSIPNAIAGQFYMLLVTNYANAAGTYTLNQTGGTGALSCDIVCGVQLGPDQLFCSSNVTSYTLTASFNQAPVLGGSPVYTWSLNGVVQTTTTTNTLTVSQNGTWKVSVVRPGCSDLAEDEIEIRFDSPPNANIPPDLNGTAGACSPIFDLTEVEIPLLLPRLPSEYIVKYYLDEGDCFAGNANFIPNPTAFQVSTNTTIYVRIENIGNAICSDTSQYFELIVDCVPPTCELDLTSPIETISQTVCLNSAIDAIVYTIGGDATGAVVTGLPTGVTATVVGNIVTISGSPSQSGVFNYQVETEGCATNEVRLGSITVSVLPTVNSVTSNSPICRDELGTFTITGTPGAVVSYAINGGAIETNELDTNGQFVINIPNVQVAQAIVVSLISDGTCSKVLDISSQIVLSPQPTTPTISVNSPTFCLGANAVFTVNGGAGEVVFYTINGGAEQSVTLSTEGVGVITATSPTESVVVEIVRVAKGSCESATYATATLDPITCAIPKGVSPNNDGLNDTWDLSSFDIKEVEIFNRYGTKVYSQAAYTNQWYGQSDSGKELPDGTYYYVVKLNDLPAKTGWVYINRER